MSGPIGIDRDKAMLYAVELALVARDGVLSESRSTEWIRAAVAGAEAWIMIHDRLDLDPGSLDPEPPVEPYPGIKTEGDESPVIVTCGHILPALLHAGRWLHPYSLVVCDDPPTKGARDDG